MSVALKSSVLDEVRAIVVATIKVSAERLDLDAEFAELGVDSIIAMELMESLSKHFAISFTPAQFLNVNTVRELADYLGKEFGLGQGAVAAAAVPVTVAAPLASAAKAAVASPGAPLAQALLDAVRSAYAIDLPGRAWQSVDDLVDEIVANNLEQAMRRFDVVGTPAFHAAAPARGATLDIAIVGLSCRFPDAPDARVFWRNLMERKSSLREIPASRWNWEQHYADTPAAGKTISKWGALIDDVDAFDPQFFRLRPEEARLIDPQERLLMQEVYRAIEDAGIDAGTLAGSATGVFVGYEYAEYEQYLRRNIDRIPGLVCSSSSPSYYLANRLSYSFDFRGPSETVNVNCASSAVAINRACLSLAMGESTLAIAGAAHLNLFAGDYITSSQYGLLSPNGSCAVFDNEANGFTRGEGVGVVVLKPLAAAEADGDRIYGVIKSCHQNNRGQANTLSDVKHEAITEVVRRCYEKAGLDTASIRYIELNGYAKKWADSFEFEGLKNVFDGAEAAAGKRCALGSLKGNIGHLEPVNGVASLIKVALSLHHQKFPATVTRRVPSSFIDLASSAHPLYFAEDEIDFAALREADGTPVRAGVSSFADSGVNVHIALEEYRPRAASAAKASSGAQLFVLSARDRHRLADSVEAHIAFIAQAAPGGAALDFASVVHTLQVGRKAMAARVAVVAASLDELHGKLCLLKESGIGGRAKLEGMGIFYGEAEGAERGTLSHLITPEMTRLQLQQSLQTRQWQQVALLWVNGIEIPWAEVWTGQAVQRVSLPGYAFAKERHWVDVADGPVVAATSPPRQAEALIPTPGVDLGAASLPWQFHAAGAALHGAAVPMAPAAKLELFMRQEVARLRPCSLDDVEPDAHFASLGISSIGIAELVTRLNQLLQVNLAPTAVFKHPQIDALAGYLAQAHAEKAAAVTVTAAMADVAATPAASSAALSAPGARVQAPTPTHASAFLPPELLPEVLVPMQTRGRATPLFLVPGADGSVLSFKLLCEALGTERPLYGFDAVGLQGGPLPASVEQVAHINLTAMRSVQPQGPYRLLGYSNGGVVAFEMTRQLLEAGEAVASLTLLDSLCPGERKMSPLDLVAEVFNHLAETLGGRLDLTAEGLAQIPQAEQAEHLYRMLGEHGLQLPHGYFMATYRVSTASEAMVRAYAMAPLPAEVDVTLIRAVQSYRDVPADYGWNRCLRRPLHVQEVAASHYTVIEAVGVPQVVACLSGLAPAAEPEASPQASADTTADRAAKARPDGRHKKKSGPSVAVS